MEQDLVPKNEQGAQSNTESSITLSSEIEADNYFKLVRDRFLNINQWQEYAGTGSAEFQLTDKNGNEVSRQPEKGDHFRISIPAPGTKTGEGYDWVQVEETENEKNCIAIRVRPATNPMNDNKDVAHFFQESATSSFIIKRDGLTIVAGVYGRNEVPNTEADSTMDKIRNAAVATGAMAGFSKLQWKSLVEGFLK